MLLFVHMLNGYVDGFPPKKEYRLLYGLQSDLCTCHNCYSIWSCLQSNNGKEGHGRNFSTDVQFCFEEV